MSAAAAAPPLIALGPPGWVALGALAVLSVGVAIWAMSEKADEAAKDEETGCKQGCPDADSKDKDKTAAEPRDYPANPDDLKDEGYEETTHPKAAKAGVRTFKNPKTGDEVDFNKGKPGKPGWEGKDHYHRYNPKKTGTGKDDYYLDKNGRPVRRGSKPSHLKPRQ